jgi:hypothetical protein
LWRFLSPKVLPMFDFSSSLHLLWLIFLCFRDGENRNLNS